VTGESRTPPAVVGVCDLAAITSSFRNDMVTVMLGNFSGVLMVVLRV
jgi:hypothetical protein